MLLAAATPPAAPPQPVVMGVGAVGVLLGTAAQMPATGGSAGPSGLRFRFAFGSSACVPATGAARAAAAGNNSCCPFSCAANGSAGPAAAAAPAAAAVSAARAGVCASAVVLPYHSATAAAAAAAAATAAVGAATAAAATDVAPLFGSSITASPSRSSAATAPGGMMYPSTASRIVLGSSTSNPKFSSSCCVTSPIVAQLGGRKHLHRRVGEGMTVAAAHAEHAYQRCSHTHTPTSIFVILEVSLPPNLVILRRAALAAAALTLLPLLLVAAWSTPDRHTSRSETNRIIFPVHV